MREGERKAGREARRGEVRWGGEAGQEVRDPVWPARARVESGHGRS